MAFQKSVTPVHPSSPLSCPAPPEIGRQHAHTHHSHPFRTPPPPRDLQLRDGGAALPQSHRLFPRFALVFPAVVQSIPHSRGFPCVHPRDSGGRDGGRREGGENRGDERSETVRIEFQIEFQIDFQIEFE